MGDATEQHGASRRGFAARAGIAALNIPVPGLGLLRLGEWRTGLSFVAATLALLAVAMFGMGHFPVTNFGRVLIGMVIAVACQAALTITPAILTWRKSKYHAAIGKWSRWPRFVPIAIILFAVLQLGLMLGHSFYKPFYLPAESMAPTAGKGDKVIADMRWRGPLKRGDIILFNGPSTVRISRIAALAGDRIAMRGGVPIINGAPVEQHQAGVTTFTGYDGSHRANVLVERLPGEVSEHRILDTGPSASDDMPETIVPPDRIFVIGDNRDRSADSRVPLEFGGVGMVALTALIGRPLYIHWSSDRAKIGTRLDK